ncbi:hypothetical protein ACWEWQ_18525, partial [Streptomyces sp. NPDC003832]
SMDMGIAPSPTALAIDDTLTFVPYRDLPPWFKWQTYASRVRAKLDSWRLTLTYAAEDAWKAVRRRR